MKVHSDAPPPEGYALNLQPQPLLLARSPRQGDATARGHDTMPR